MKKQENTSQDITRKEAIKKIGNYGKYAALTALGTYMILILKKHKLKVLKTLELGFRSLLDFIQ